MSPDRLRSIVPMFGGGTNYVETLNAVLEFVDTHHPTTDELVGWHRGRFDRVSSRDSIMRRVEYLEDVGLLTSTDGIWTLGLRANDTSLIDRLRRCSNSCADETSASEACSMRSRSVQ